MKYVALLRGINVGGNNKIPMAELRTCLEELGLRHVRTYIQSGNVLFESDKTPQAVTGQIENALLKTFRSTKGPIKVLVIDHLQVRAVVDQAPNGFGTEPDKYRYDAAFLIGKSADEAMEQIEVHPEVDAAWPGNGVIYYRRLSAKLTRSRLGKVIGKPIYQSMTIRNWNTVRKLLSLTEAE